MAIKTYVYKSVGPEQQIEADFYYPETKPDHPLPLAVVIHGGAFCTGSKSVLPNNQFAVLLELGFVAVSVNYRLCPTISLYDGPITDCKDSWSWCKYTLPALAYKDTGVKVDTSRMVSLGYSAGGNLALMMAGCPDPPLAILDVYGAIYFTDSFWHTISPNLPQVAPAGPIPAGSDWAQGHPPTETVDDIAEVVMDPNVTDNPMSRVAWMISAVTHGTLMSQIVPDGQYDRVDPVTLFSKDFPPTFFIHGAADNVVAARFSEKAHKSLADMGVETQLRLVEGQDHGFDISLKEEDANFAIIREGLEFLARHARASI